MRGISNCSQVHQRDTGSTNDCNSLVLKPDNLVEAAGVEPLAHTESTSLIDFTLH